MSANEHLVDQWTSRTLRSGVTVSATLLVVGIFLAALVPPRDVAGNPSVGTIVHNIVVGRWDPLTIVSAGLLVLMLTPFFRVAAALAGFWVEKDRRYVLISAVVLVLLIGEFIYSFH